MRLPLQLGVSKSACMCTACGRGVKNRLVRLTSRCSNLLHACGKFVWSMLSKFYARICLKVSEINFGSIRETCHPMEQYDILYEVCIRYTSMETVQTIMKASFTMSRMADVDM